MDCELASEVAVRSQSRQVFSTLGFGQLEGRALVLSSSASICGPGSFMSRCDWTPLTRMGLLHFSIMLGQTFTGPPEFFKLK